MVDNGRQPSKDGMAEPITDRELYVHLYEGGGITEGELRELLASRPGALTRHLTAEFIGTVGALRRGDFHEIEARGFVIPAPSNLEPLFVIARQRIERLMGYPTALAVLSPSPTDARFALPVIVPRDVAPAMELRHARFARVRATLLNLESLGGAAARFLLAHEVHALTLEDFFAARAPSLTGADVLHLLQDRLNLDYPEVRTALLVHLFSAPPYLDRAGGTGLTLLACEDRARCLSKRALEDVLGDLRYALPPFMTGRRASATIDYHGIHPVPLRFGPSRMSWRFDAPAREAASFLKDRVPPTAGAEVSMSTRSVLEVHDFERSIKEMARHRTETQLVMSVSDLPVLLGRDDITRDERALALHEQSEDIAHAVVHAAARVPGTVLEPAERGALVDAILRDIHKDWPDLERLLRGEVLLDLGARGGLIEHATRAAGAAARALGQPPEEAAHVVKNMYVDVFARFYGELEPTLRHHLAVIEKRDRQLLEQMDRDLLDAMEGAFLTLDAKWPDGWPYPEFERLVLSRVQLGRARLRRKFDLLQQEGEVREVTHGVYMRIWGLSRFL
jgi:hypothetical protein